MITVLFVTQIVLTLILTILVLLQKSSSIGLGAYSGSNESVFGAKGPAGFLVKATFTALGLEKKIEFIDTPEDIRDKYQYFTEADMSKLRSAGYNEKFYSLEEGITDYVENYLINKDYF